MIIGDDGTVVDLVGGVAKAVGAVPCGFVYVDGSGVGETTEALLTDRRILRDEGFISIFVVVDSVTGKVAAGPDDPGPRLRRERRRLRRGHPADRGRPRPGDRVRGQGRLRAPAGRPPGGRSMGRRQAPSPADDHPGRHRGLSSGVAGPAAERPPGPDHQDTGQRRRRARRPRAASSPRRRRGLGRRPANRRRRRRCRPSSAARLPCPRSPGLRRGSTWRATASGTPPKARPHKVTVTNSPAGWPLRAPRVTSESATVAIDVTTAGRRWLVGQQTGRPDPHDPGEAEGQQHRGGVGHAGLTGQHGQVGVGHLVAEDEEGGHQQDRSYAADAQNRCRRGAATPARSAHLRHAEPDPHHHRRARVLRRRRTSLASPAARPTAVAGRHPDRQGDGPAGQGQRDRPAALLARHQARGVAGEHRPDQAAEQPGRPRRTPRVTAYDEDSAVTTLTRAKPGQQAGQQSSPGQRAGQRRQRDRPDDRRRRVRAGQEAGPAGRLRATRRSSAPAARPAAARSPGSARPSPASARSAPTGSRAAGVLGGPRGSGELAGRARIATSCHHGETLTLM